MARVRCPVCNSEFDLTNHDGCFVPSFHDETNTVIGTLTPAKVGNENNNLKGANMNKIEALKAAGFTDEQINQMVGITGVSLVGEAIAKDEIEEEIFKNGYIKNTKLHRRWITAQFVRAHFGYEYGVRHYINSLPYMYQFKMMLEEVRVISKLENEDDESFFERSSFFRRDVVVSTCKQYIKDLIDFINSKNKKDNRKCKGIPYVRLSGLRYWEFPKGDVFMEDVQKKIISPLNNCRFEVENAKTYKDLYIALNSFMHCSTFIDIAWKTPKNKLWIDAFLGAGAYYSLKNLVTYSGLKLRNYETGSSSCMDTDESIKYLKSLAGKKYGFQLYGLFKQTLKDNDFTMQTFKDICERTKKSA